MTFLDRVIGKDIVLEAHPLPLDPIRIPVETASTAPCCCRPFTTKRCTPGSSPLTRTRARASRAKFEMREDSGSQAAQLM
jgi:hypothetical protein